MLYSFKQQYPVYYSELPDRIRTSSGLTRTDKSTYTEEELLDAGYVKVEEPPVPSTFQRLEWTGTQWSLLDMTEEERSRVITQQWDIIRKSRNDRLSHTDWIILKSLEYGETISTSIKNYRQALRDITTQTDPFNIEWPILDV